MTESKEIDEKVTVIDQAKDPDGMSHGGILLEQEFYEQIKLQLTYLCSETNRIGKWEHINFLPASPLSVPIPAKKKKKEFSSL